MPALTPDAPGPLNVRMYSSAGSPETYAIREDLQRCDVPFAWQELVTDEEARAAAGVQELQDPRLPACLFPDGIGGAGLAERARVQALRFGAEFLVSRQGVRGAVLPCPTPSGRGVNSAGRAQMGTIKRRFWAVQPHLTTRV